jgi:dUTP pyrophosphatase
MDIPVIRLDPELALPKAARSGDAGLDLVARETTTIEPGGGRALVGTGFAMALPVGYAALILPRSGLAFKQGVTVLNAPGLIDSGYRGEVQVLLVNTDPTTPCTVERGERIAQLMIREVIDTNFVVVDELDDSSRGTSGWGSTG